MEVERRSMKTFLWAVVVLALEVLLLCGYLGVVGVKGTLGRNVPLALLVGTVSVVVWLGFNSGFERTLKRLVRAVVGCIIVTSAVLMVVSVFVEIPFGVICDRWKPNAEIYSTSTTRGGYFVEHRIGPCVYDTHKGG